ncbi:MAG: YciI family protein [Rhizobiaceae bacterium]
MTKFIYAFHGGAMPETPEEGEKVMAAWRSWMESLGDAMIDPGAPVGMSKTVTPGGVSDDGGSNPLSGYTVVNAANIDEAVEMSKGCPILESGGSIEVAECMDM